jgi:hypothetical protein
MHLGGETIQHFKTMGIRTWLAISLILGLALVTFGCDTDKLVSVELASSKSRQSVNKEDLSAIYSYSGNCELLSYIEYEYDSNGNRTKWSKYNVENGEVDSYTVYLYKKI